MEFKILTQMKLSYESKQNFMKLDEHEIQLLSEINQALQLLQTGVIRSSDKYCKSCNSENILIDISCEPNELICDDCWSLNISTKNKS